MNEEISRILQLLEAGNINAEEAERLIRAVREEPGSYGRRDERTRRHGGRSPEEPFRSLRELFRHLSEAQMRAMRRQIRWHWWRHYIMARREAAERRQRAATMSTADRVRFVLLERVQIEDREPAPAARLADLLASDCCGWQTVRRTAWENLRFGLEDEFSLTLDAGELERIETVKDLIDYVEARVPPRAEPSGAPPEQAPSTAAETRAETAVLPGARKRGEPASAEPPPGEPGEP